MSSTCTEDHIEIQRIEVTYDKSHSQTAVAPGKTGMLLRNLPMFSQEISYQKSYTLTGEKKGEQTKIQFTISKYSKSSNKAHSEKVSKH